MTRNPDNPNLIPTRETADDVPIRDRGDMWEELKYSEEIRDRQGQEQAQTSASGKDVPQ
jgi:hypothetical protein